MRISDWSSDVCSSDLVERAGPVAGAADRGQRRRATVVRRPRRRRLALRDRASGSRRAGLINAILLLQERLQPPKARERSVRRSRLARALGGGTLARRLLLRLDAGRLSLARLLARRSDEHKS